MEKEKFLKTLRNDLLVIQGSGYDYKYKKIYKNNGVYLDAIVISKKGENLGKTLVVNYEWSDEYDEIYNKALYLADDYENCADLAVDVGKLIEWENSEKLIIFKIINKEANSELLESLPHVVLSDLVMIFMICLEGEDGILTAMIDNDMVAKWGINPNDLTEIARKNTMEKYSALVIEVGDEDLKLPLEIMRSNKLFILTNQEMNNGASVIFYNGVLKELANKLESDLLIIPSSTHEVLVFKIKNQINYYNY